MGKVKEMTFGELVADRRTKMGTLLPRSGLAEKIGRSTTTIELIEKGHRNPSTEVAIDILNALNIDFQIVDDHTLQVEGGPTYSFNHAKRGRNKKGCPKQPVSRVTNYDAQIAALEARVSALEQLVISQMASQRKVGI